MFAEKFLLIKVEFKTEKKNKPGMRLIVYGPTIT
jgi:hypothetical protein